MAIVLPVLLLLVFGIIEMSNAWRTHQVVTNIVREGARVAILPNVDEDSVRTVMAARIAAQGLSTPDTIVVKCNTTGTDGVCAGTGQEAEVQMDYPFTFRLLGPIVQWVCGGSCSGQFGTIMIGSTTVMRKE
jgi:Flp pilus assembly protein TadG